MKKISIIVPVYNEEANVEKLHSEIKSVCEAQRYLYEIIFVDDGSSDATFKILKSLSPVIVIRFRKNFGQTAAMDAGFKKARYDYIITMDGDGQNDPNDIPKLIEHLEETECDVVSGWRKHRKDTFMKKFISRGANVLRKVLINDGIHDSGCSLKLYRKDCFERLTIYGEMHRFIPALLKIQGFKISEIVVNHRPRTAGKTKYNMSRTIKGFIDMLSVWFWNKYAVRPLHLLGGIGFFFIFLSIVSGSITLLYYFQGGKMASTPLPLMTAFFFLGGIQFFISGLLADIMVKDYYETTKNRPYIIKEVFE